MLKWLDIYLGHMECSEEMLTLVRNFFLKIAESPHYIRNEVNDLLFEILVRNVKFRVSAVPNGKKVEAINDSLLKSLKEEFLILVGDKLIIDSPPPAKVAHPFARKKIPEPKDE